MKLKIIAIIDDGVIAANKNNVVCFDGSSLRDSFGEDRLDDSKIYIGAELSNNNYENADTFWWYNKKEFEKIVNGFKSLK